MEVTLDEDSSDDEVKGQKEGDLGLKVGSEGGPRWLTSIDLRGCEYTPQVGCPLASKKIG